MTNRLNCGFLASAKPQSWIIVQNATAQLARILSISILCALLVRRAGADYVFTPYASSKPEIEAIIENVRANERLYDDIDVVLTTEFSIGSRPPTQFGEGILETTSERSAVHYVGQDGLFRLERSGTSTNARGAMTRDRVRAFDGETTRLYDQNAIGNVIVGKAEDELFVRPHMVFFRTRTFSAARLSTYMSGENELKKHPLVKWTDGLRIKTEYLGDEEVDGLRCHRVSVGVTASDGSPANRSELWLAVDRNYIPVRLRAYTYGVSSDLPVSEGRCANFNEVEPGIWFPSKIDHTAYREALLREKKERQINWRISYTTKSISLRPQYSPGYFKDVEFPNGTKVYEVEAGVIKAKYVQGGHNANSPGLGITLIWVNIAAVLLAGAGVFIFRRARGTGSAGAPRSDL